MAKLLPTPPPEFDKLPVAEQIDYVQSLWDRIAASPEQVPVPEWHKRVIRERPRKIQPQAGFGKTFVKISNTNCRIVDLTNGTASRRPTSV